MKHRISAVIIALISLFAISAHAQPTENNDQGAMSFSPIPEDAIVLFPMTEVPEWLLPVPEGWSPPPDLQVPEGFVVTTYAFLGELFDSLTKCDGKLSPGAINEHGRVCVCKHEYFKEGPYFCRWEG